MPGVRKSTEQGEAAWRYFATTAALAVTAGRLTSQFLPARWRRAVAPIYRPEWNAFFEPRYSVLFTSMPQPVEQRAL